MFSRIKEKIKKVIKRVTPKISIFMYTVLGLNMITKPIQDFQSMVSNLLNNFTKLFTTILSNIEKFSDISHMLLGKIEIISSLIEKMINLLPSLPSIPSIPVSIPISEGLESVSNSIVNPVKGLSHNLKTNNIIDNIKNPIENVTHSILPFK
ncbi:hypothetical protein [Dasineura jujubifolia toursvirus 2a]|nr:hypothetical protein [Dasineura jujubifolia toursvirus 2a]